MKALKRLTTILLAIIMLTASLSHIAFAANTGSVAAKEQTTENEKEQVALTDDLPTYLARAYEFVNNGHPAFTEQELVSIKKTTYSSLDNLNRCGVCTALLGPETIQKNERKDKDIKNPTGWSSVLFEGSKDEYLYVRTRLIGWKLDGAKEDLRNLLTGTAQFANEGMAVIEALIAGYIEVNGNHVLYRATPVYREKNLLAEGVLIEAESVEDKGESLQICVYCYNLQPGVEIDYATGKTLNKVEKITPLEALTGAAAAITGGRSNTEAAVTPAPNSSVTENSSTSSNKTESSDVVTYVGNKSTKKFHYPNCKSVSQMKEKNKVFFYGDRSEPASKGYDSCKNCNP